MKTVLRSAVGVIVASSRVYRPARGKLLSSEAFIHAGGVGTNSLRPRFRSG